MNVKWIFTVFWLLNISIASAQVFIPFGAWQPKRNVSVQCESGCYPTPNTPFTSALYYLPIGSSAVFSANSTTNPSGFDWCWGPNASSGCLAGAFGGSVAYPLTCSVGSDSIDGSSDDNQATYSGTANSNSTCTVTNFGEGKAATTFVVRSFNGVSITSPITSAVAPQNICVTQTQVINATGGIGTLAWTVPVGGGSVAPLTGNSTTFTAPNTAQSVQVQVTDPTTSMPAIAYFNIVSTISLSPLGTIEVPINPSTNLFSTNTTVANLNMKANCGVANYSCGATGGGSVTPTSGIANNASVTFTPAATTGTSTITFTDSTPVTPQTATLTIKNIFPVEMKANATGWAICTKYSHSTYTAGTYKLKCWGYNGFGQMAQGTVSGNQGDAATEIGYGVPFVKDSSGSDIVIKDFAVGYDHVCVIRSDDTIKCWGTNAKGQLGYDDTTARSSVPAATVAVAGGTPAKIYAGVAVTCVVFTNTLLKCWGKNNQGQLGQNNTTIYGSAGGASSVGSLGYVSVAGANVTVTKVALSNLNTCVLTTGGSVYCWGYGSNNTTCGTGKALISPTATPANNDYCGELGRAGITGVWGDGTNNLSGLPALNFALGGGEAIIDIWGSSHKHFCALVVTSPAIAGRPKCWGYNGYGQLGIESGAIAQAPTAMVTLATVESMGLLRRSSCAVLTGGTMKCFGRNSNGQGLTGNNTQYGDAGGEMASIPASNLGTGRTVKSVSGGYYYSCAILDNDTMKCWGSSTCDGSTTAGHSGCLLTGTASNANTNYGTAAGSVGDNLKFLQH